MSFAKNASVEDLDLVIVFGIFVSTIVKIETQSDVDD